MNKLSLLELSGDFFKGNYNVYDSQPFGKLGNKLRWFSWFEYPGEYLPKCFQPRNLVHLHMEYSKIKETPDFSHMPNLEVLNLRHSKMLVHVHPSLGNHMKIKHINLESSNKLEVFPEINRMRSIEILDLRDTTLKKFPEIYENLDSLRRLDLNGTQITTLPMSIRRATSLEILRMINCEYLLTLPISFLGLQVQTMYIKSGSLKSFEENIDDETASRRSKRREQLIGYEGMGQLSGLQIFLLFCNSLEELPESLLSRIELLVIAECPNLTCWICFNLVDLLDKYQHLCYLKLYLEYEVVPQEILQACSERVCNVSTLFIFLNFLAFGNFTYSLITQSKILI
ncbi:hypothetical protein Leryth_026649 [Lithospermum erythrorhizon]|nr:hypothetical protein Leryth_026649 [Lithospermum erythrorhizon]